MSSTTAFASICDGIVAALLVEPALAGGHVERARRVPVPVEWDEHVEVRVGIADGTKPFVGPGTPGVWETQVMIDCYARAAAGDQPYDRLDALLSAVDERIQAVDLGALGVTDVSPAVHIEWDFEPGANPQALASYGFTVRHDVRGTGLRVS